MYGSQKSHYPCLKCHENEEKIDNDRVLRNDYRIKTTQPFSMILVSFFSEDNILYDEIKIYNIFSNINVTKIERSAFFFVETQYMRVFIFFLTSPSLCSLYSTLYWQALESLFSYTGNDIITFLANNFL